jgi:pyruvate/2-oxoglutarate dehydrogenase complex dihydrolipoamide dehydrogenase (E3) component/uncharacterized membrane protein YdjX (TVP38/TMEM64 family)
MKKILYVATIALLVSVFIFFDLHKYLSLGGMKTSLESFKAYQAQAPGTIVFGFFAIYVLVTAVAFPGAAILTLAAGALFGFVWGTVIASFASTVGATISFLSSRYLLRGFVESKFSERLKGIDEGMKRDGALYLFSLRLVPIFPFFLVNLLVGLTNIKTVTFYWVSQLGMLAGTAVYVNAGTQLANINSLSTILTPGLTLSFVLLGVFPLITKWFLSRIKASKQYKGWKKPAKFDRNLVVIGGGAAGLVTSYIGATVKAKVTLIETHKMGGDCLNYGCVPSKALIKSAKVASLIRDAEHYGLNSTNPNFSFRKVMNRVANVVEKVSPHDSKERYEGLGVDVVEGFAKIVDPWTVEIQKPDGSKESLTTRSIVIATGAQPFIPPIPGLEQVGYVTSDTVWEKFGHLDNAPERLVVLGGGPIGCELSQSFARLGSQVIQVERGGRLMVREDIEVSLLAASALIGSGVEVLTDHEAIRCELEDGHKYLIVRHNNVESRIEFDELLCAVGRSARLSGFGLEELGIKTHRTLPVNEYLETIYPNIFAAGDVAGPYQFTHTAAHMAWYASVNALFGRFKKFKVDYSVIPWATFIDPEVARVGLNEQDAKEKGVAYEVTKFELEELDRAIAEGAETGFIKILTVPGKDRILGVTIVGEHAAELLSEFVLAMKHGLGLNKILNTIHTYPTMSEANKYAAGEWKRAHAPQKILSWLKKFHTWQRG